LRRDLEEGKACAGLILAGLLGRNATVEPKQVVAVVVKRQAKTMHQLVWVTTITHRHGADVRLNRTREALREALRADAVTNGYVNPSDKTDAYYVRCVRRGPVDPSTKRRKR
jgi:hypothetical protein